MNRTPGILPVSYPTHSHNSAPDVKISIELLDHPITVTVNFNETVEKLKEKIRKQVEASDDEEITLLYEGETLEDDRTLASYKITKESVIYQVAENTEESENKSLSFGFKFNKLTDVQLQEFNRNAPAYRVVCAGLNLRGMCVTNGCQAFNQVVWIQKGMGTFDIGIQSFESICSICKKTADKIDNLGFYDCVYSITGYQTQPERKKIDQKDLIADNKKFTTFVQTNEFAHWVSLTVTTKPRNQ